MGKSTRALAADLVWKEFEYRHDLFWRSLFKWGSAFIVISIVPWVRPDLESQLGRYVLVFPVFAFLLGVGASWHLAAEYHRLMPILQSLKTLRERLGVPTTLVVLPWHAQGNIGKVAYLGFFWTLTGVSVANGVLLTVASSSST